VTRARAALDWLGGLCVLALAALGLRVVRDRFRRRPLIPVCAWCQKVREDGRYSRRIDAYVGAHQDIDCTHGICPECRDAVIREHAAARH
jgi:hypothetical protein